MYRAEGTATSSVIVTDSGVEVRSLVVRLINHIDYLIPFTVFILKSEFKSIYWCFFQYSLDFTVI